MGYYAHAVVGHLDLMARRQEISALISDPATDPALRTSLTRVLAIRRFASDELGLPDNRSYRSYADTGRQYVVWNVFAAPELDLTPLTWCYPFAGCVGYRGFYNEAAAQRFATRLRRQGNDVYVAGVSAYSTLGWFNDPVVNTMLYREETALAGVIFHELAHQRLYVEDDTLFNESFARTVEQEGVRRWLAARGTDAQRRQWERRLALRRPFLGLVERTRERLAAVYDSPASTGEKRRGKARILAAMGAEFDALAAGEPGLDRYEAWMRRGVDNAKLNAVRLYEGLVPAFEALLAQVGGDLGRFYARCAALGELPRDERHRRLAALVIAPAPADHPAGDRSRRPCPPSMAAASTAGRWTAFKSAPGPRAREAGH
jgi:predicted aminopeptidase